MPVPNFSGLGPYPTFDDVTNKINKLVNELRNLLLNLDTLNISQLNADVVNTGILNTNLVTISASDGSYSYTFDGTGFRANNGSVDTLDFDLATGLLTIVSALIQSASGYPRIELNNSANLLGAYQTANESIRIDPAGTSGDPAISFYSGGFRMGSMQYLSPDVLIFTANGVANITLSSGISLKLEATNDVRIACSFLKINGFTGQSASINYVKNVVAGVPSFGTMNFTDGILTSWT